MQLAANLSNITYDIFKRTGSGLPDKNTGWFWSAD
jgi:hypothetical protein